MIAANNFSQAAGHQVCSDAAPLNRKLPIDNMSRFRFAWTG